MPDVASVLERAAATPTRGPRIPHRPRWPYLAIAGVVFAISLITIIVRLVPHETHHKVNVGESGSVTTTTTLVTHSNNATISIPSGWYGTDEPLAWWLSSPYELFSIATNPLPPSPHKQPNEAACPSEIPQVAVDNLAADGAYLWVGEWRGGIYQTEPRPADASSITYQALCALPRGEKAFGTILRDGSHDYTITYVLGPDASPALKTQIDAMLNSLTFDTP